MKRRALFVAILLVAIGVVILVVTRRPSANTLLPGTIDVKVAEGVPVDKQAETTVLYTSDGFMPRTLTIKQGVEVVFINTTAQLVRPQADGVSGDCQVKEQLDSCEAITPGGSYRYTATESKTVSYHDALRPGTVATIVVE